VIRRRTQHELSKVEAREHIVEGLIRALDRIDGIVEVVRKAPDTAAARATLMGKDYAMTEPQANAILALTLGRWVGRGGGWGWSGRDWGRCVMLDADGCVCVCVCVCRRQADGA
jgi:hypothetical protein